jgi:hypothetical protein
VAKRNPRRRDLLEALAEATMDLIVLKPAMTHKSIVTVDWRSIGQESPGSNFLHPHYE